MRVTSMTTFWRRIIMSDGARFFPYILFFPLRMPFPTMNHETNV